MRDMYRVLRRPRWIAMTIVVTVLAGVFVALGTWQLDRLDQRRLANRVQEARLTADPLPVDVLLSAAGEDVDSLEYRRTTATGTYRVDEEMLVRNRTHDGVAGFWVLTPLELDSGLRVVVARGWVPLDLADRPPVAEVPPPSGVVTVEGFVRLDEDRPRFGPVDPPGPQPVFNRVDLDRIAEQVPAPLAPVWIQRVDDGSRSLPFALALPDTTDEGPHLGYAIQWFSFAIIAVVGFAFLIRREVRGRRS